MSSAVRCRRRVPGHARAIMRALRRPTTRPSRRPHPRRRSDRRSGRRGSRARRARGAVHRLAADEAARVDGEEMAAIGDRHAALAAHAHDERVEVTLRPATGGLRGEREGLAHRRRHGRLRVRVAVVAELPPERGGDPVEGARAHPEVALGHRALDAVRPERPLDPEVEVAHQGRQLVRPRRPHQKLEREAAVDEGAQLDLRARIAEDRLVPARRLEQQAADQCHVGAVRAPARSRGCSPCAGGRSRCRRR